MRTPLITLSTILLLIFQSHGQNIHDRFFLSGNRTAEELSTLLLEKWNNVPTFSDRSKWEALDGEVKKLLIENGESALKQAWPILTASMYQKFTEIGDRVGYESLYFERRRILQDLVFAELVMGNGKYLEKIIDGIWMVCEESTWSIPAHLYLQAAGTSALPQPEEHVVDLFAAETGATLSWIYYLLESPLDDYSPIIRERISTEVTKRILTPNLTRNDFWWMAFEDPGRVNNWNPWINSNWINCITLIEKDPKKKAEALYKSMKSLDHFINHYPEDGGCDEGPSYWSRAGGSMFDCLDALSQLTDGSINIFKQQVIKNMASYIYEVNIDGDYYVNFADAAAKSYPPLELIYNWGESANEKSLMEFAIAKTVDFKSFYPSQSMNRGLRAIFTYPKIKNKTASVPIVQDAWLKESEIYISRDYKNSINGFFLAGKGGHNAESHNHNDVGNYIIYYNGKPIVIDIGVEQYSAKTFSDQRYDIWTMQSQFHTLPIVNGLDQVNGRAYAANHLSYDKKGPMVTMEMNLENAYPEAANLQQWKRKLTHRKGKFIEVEETIHYKEVSGSTILNFITPCKVVIESGQLFFEQSSDDGPFEIKLLFDKDQLKPKVESIEVNDPRLQQSWGNRLYRVQLEMIAPQNDNKISYSFYKK